MPLGNVPLSLVYRASWLGFHRILKRILHHDHSAEPDRTLRGDEACLSSPLHQAVRFGHLKTIKVLLRRHGPSKKELTRRRESIIRTSIYQGSEEIVRLLLRSGKISLLLSSVQRDNCVHTPLEGACSCGYKKAIKCLLQLEGAGPRPGRYSTTFEGTGWLPLVLAASKGFPNCVSILLESGVDPNQCGPSGDFVVST